MKKIYLFPVVLAFLATFLGSCDNVATPVEVPAATGPDTIQVPVDSSTCSSATVAPTETVSCK